MEQIIGNKNVASIITGYLTEAPALPFIGELDRETRSIFAVINQYWFYENFFVVQSNKRRIGSVYGIHKNIIGWII